MGDDNDRADRFTHQLREMHWSSGKESAPVEPTGESQRPEQPDQVDDAEPPMNPGDAARPNRNT